MRRHHETDSIPSHHKSARLRDPEKHQDYKDQLNLAYKIFPKDTEKINQSSEFIFTIQLQGNKTRPDKDPCSFVHISMTDKPCACRMRVILYFVDRVCANCIMKYRFNSSRKIEFS